MNKNNSKDNITQEIMNILREQSKKEGITINQLILDLLKKSNDTKEKSKKADKKEKKSGQTIDVIADLSKLLPQNNPEFIEILQKIADSIVNIEREHAQGWSDQREDLQAISKRIDKLL